MWIRILCLGKTRIAKGRILLQSLWTIKHDGFDSHSSPQPPPHYSLWALSSHLLSSPKPIDWAKKTDSTLLHLFFWLMPKSHVAIQNMSQIIKHDVENFLVSDFGIFFRILTFV